MVKPDTTILVVEDEGIVAWDIQQSLTMQGYDVPRVINCGTEAIKAATEIQPDLILMDIHLQGEMDGIQAAQSIVMSSDIPIIFLTAFADAQTVEKATLIQPYSYIVKPYDDVELLAAVEIALHKHSADKQITIQKTWLETILCSIGDAVVVTDQHGIVTFLNPTAEALTQWSQESAIGQKIEQVITCITDSDGKTIENPLRKAIRKGQKVGIPSDTLLITKDKLQIPIDDSATPIRNSRGECIGAVIVFKDISDRVLSEQRLAHQAFHDHLTDLPNRALFLDRVEKSIARYARYPKDSFALLFLDLDRFKLVNDSFGHSAGDQLLVQATQRILSCLRPSDTLARLGGDEFAILVEKVTAAEIAAEIANRILQILRQPFGIEDQNLYISVSIGIVQSDRHYNQSDEMLRDADIAMYQAKSSGKGCYKFFDTTMYTEVKGFLKLENDLRQALLKQQLEVYFQPCIALDSKAIIGFEALVRWPHPELGYISPSKFIPIAEETGLIILLDSFVLLEACSQMKRWQQQYPAAKHMKMSVNMSSKQLLEPHIVEKVETILTDITLAPECLQIEITERVLINNFEIASKVFADFKALGISMSLDDFGTGYSSLSYLHRFPIKILKIDRSFIELLSNNDEKLEFVRTIILLAHSLGMTAIAEGIESEDQYTKLKELDCEQGQGFLFYKPVSAHQIEELLKSQVPA